MAAVAHPVLIWCSSGAICNPCPSHTVLTDLSVKLDTLKRLIRSLPECNRDTMDYIFAHFNR